MRHLHSLLYFIGVGALIAGLIDCVAISLGGSSGNHLLATGFVLLAVGNGLRFNGAGNTPPRASYILLGLAGALPLFSGMAPLSALFAALLFLPLRALGANLGTAIESHKANSSLLLFCALIGANLIPGVAVGIPGFICVWALTGILQRYYPTKAREESNSDVEFPELLPPFVGGVATTMMVLLFLPYATVFDYATTADNTIRGNTLLLVFALSWFTLAAGLADTLSKLTLRISSVLLAGSAFYSLGFIEQISASDTYSRFFQDQRILDFANANSPLLAEENALYVPLMTVLCFAIPIALIAVFLRTIITSRKHFSSTLCGIAAAFIIIAIAPREMALSSRLALTVGSFIAVFLLSFKPVRSSKFTAATVSAASIAACLFLTASHWQPTIHLSARSNHTWMAEEGSSIAQLSHIERQLSTTYQDQKYSTSFDGRVATTPLPNNHRSYLQSDAFINTLTADNHNPILISDPEQLIHSAGGHSLIKLYADAQFIARRSLLRHELFRQASMRLAEDGLCVLRVAADELTPHVAPQIAQSFSDVFSSSKVFVYSDTLEIPYLIFVGSNQEITLSEAAKAIEVKLVSNTNVDAWMLQGPWRPVDYLLAANHPVLNPKVSKHHRASAVLTDLASHQADGTESLLKFYAAHLQSQEYSVHDTYLQDNPLSTETTDVALAELMIVTKLHPHSLHLQQLWRNVGLVLVESREVSWTNTYFGDLYEQGWDDDFVLLSLAHAALESLDFEVASSLCKTILERYPQHLAAGALLELAQKQQQVPRDGHVGHNH